MTGSTGSHGDPDSPSTYTTSRRERGTHLSAAVVVAPAQVLALTDRCAPVE